MTALSILLLVTGLRANGGELPETTAAFGAVLKTWAAKHKIRRAFVIVRQDGRTAHESALGGADPHAPVPLASLSKAITAACVAALIRDGKLAFDTPLSAALAKFIVAHAAPRDPRLGRVTIAQLLTHRAGFPTGDDDDPASGRNLDRYLKQHSSRAPPRPELLAATLRSKLTDEPGTRYAYGNAAYQLLGAIIEEASGRPYLSYCNDAALKPLGLSADYAPAWAVTWSFAGWRMKAEDYLALLDGFADEPRLGAAATAWLADRSGKDSSDRSAWYGLGTFVRKGEHGLDFWHWGSWDYTPEKGDRGTVRTSFVAHAARMSDGTGWFVHAEPRVEEGAPRDELGDALARAYGKVKSFQSRPGEANQ